MALRPADRVAVAAAAFVGGVGVVTPHLLGSVLSVPESYWLFATQYGLELAALGLGFLVALRIGGRPEVPRPRQVATAYAAFGLLGVAAGPAWLVLSRPAGVPLVDSGTAVGLQVARFLPAFVLAGLAGVPLGAARSGDPETRGGEEPEAEADAPEATATDTDAESGSSELPGPAAERATAPPRGGAGNPDRVRDVDLSDDRPWRDDGRRSTDGADDVARRRGRRRS